MNINAHKFPQILDSFLKKKIISDSMVSLKGTRNPYVIISERLGYKYTSRQLCHYWRNYLDPELCHDSLEDIEKQFIDEWILKCNGGSIKWVKLRQDLKKEFGRLRSENMAKNYHYSKERRQKHKAASVSPGMIMINSKIENMSPDHVMSDDEFMSNVDEDVDELYDEFMSDVDDEFMSDVDDEFMFDVDDEFMFDVDEDVNEPVYYDDDDDVVDELDEYITPPLEIHEKAAAATHPVYRDTITTFYNFNPTVNSNRNYPNSNYPCWDGNYQNPPNSNYPCLDGNYQNPPNTMEPKFISEVFKLPTRLLPIRM